MPVFPAIGGVVRIAFEGVQANQPWVNTLHMNHSDGVQTQESVDTVAAEVGTKFETAIYPVCSNEFGLLRCVVTQLDSVTAPQGTASFSGAGALTGGLAPLSTARVVKETIPRRYRGGHPRFYLGGTRQSDVEAANGRQLTSAAQAAGQTAVGSFLADLNATTVAGQTYQVVCVHYFSKHALLTAPIVDVVSAFSLDAILGTQRRRLQR